MDQLCLPLKLNIEYGHEDYILSDSNMSVYKAVSGANWPHNRLLIIGESGSGKSHLCNVWHAIKPESIFLNYDDEYMRHNHLIVEDIDEVFGGENKDMLERQSYLFHIINYATVGGRSLLLTAKKYPDFTLADLQSRIDATLQFSITPPDESLQRVILTKQFHDKQLMVSSEALNYLLPRINRSYAAIKHIVDLLDEFALKRKREITIPMIKEILKLYDA